MPDTQPPADAPASEGQRTPSDDPHEGEFRLSFARVLGLLGSRELDDPLDPLLQLVGKGIDVSRAYLFQFRDEGRRMDNTHEWCAPGVTPEKDRLQGLSADTFSWWVEELRAGRGIAAGTLAELPPEAAAEREILEAQGVTAVLVFPLRASDGELLGFMGFDEVKGPRSWTSRETESLSLICQLGTRELELRRAAESLRRLQERIGRTERIARVGGWEFDPESGRTWWSDQASEILGAGRGTRPQTLFDFFQRVHPEDRDRARKVTLSAMDEERPFRCECRLTPDGDEFRHVEIQGELFVASDGRPRVVGTLQDITDRRRLEDQLGQAQRMEVVGKLAGGVAHDFNNLLLVILGTAELLLERVRGGQGSELRDDVLQILSAAERGAALTRKLLDFSRRRVLEPRSSELNDVVGEMEAMLRRLLTEERALEMDLSDEVELVRIDRGQLEQIVMNLAMNAREAMDLGGTLRVSTVRVDLDRAREVEPGQVLDVGSYAVLSMADDGHGMSPEVRTRVFEPFFSTRNGEEGAGLGLASVYGIARQAGGAITVESEPGVGSLFQVYLPMVAAAPESESIPDMAELADGTEGSNGDLGSAREHILLVEDDVAVARLASRVLEREGYRVQVAHLPEDALRMAQEWETPPSLVITDMVMPGMRGAELLREIRRDHPEIRALFMSGYPLGSVHRSGMIEPGAPFLAKPFSGVRLLAAVRGSLATPAATG